MKKVLVIVIALFTMVSCATINKNTITEKFTQTTESGNVAEELVSLINGYTEKINAVESVYDLFFISEKCYKEKMAFEKNYAEEITTFKSSLTEEALSTYDEAIKNAMSKFEEAVNKKAKTLSEKQDAKE